MQITNNTLVGILAFAIFISLFGTLIGFEKMDSMEHTTGFATLNTTGLAQLTVNTTADVRFVVNSVNWGSGSVNVSLLWCMMNTTGAKSPGCQSFTTVSQGLTLVNDGNNNVSVQLYSNVSAVTFLGGTNPNFEYNVSNNITGSCQGSGVTPTVFTDVNTTLPGTQICPLLDFNPTKNSLLIGVLVNFSYDAPQGAKSALFNAVGTAL